MKTIALIGMPNTGKSTFFNRLTGASARVGNWPGMTVDLMSARVLIGDVFTEVVDLPGIYSFHGFSDDEKVVRDFLERHPVDLVCILLNATQIDRQLHLVLQVQQLGVPLVVVLNMADEARRHGVIIDLEALSQSLDVDTVAISAKYGEGTATLTQTLQRRLKVDQPKIALDLKQAFKADHLIEEKAAQAIARAVTLPLILEDQKSAALDRWLLHPILGLPFFFGLMLLLFEGIFRLGKPLQDGIAWLLAEGRSQGLDLWLSPLPSWMSGLLLDGLYNGVGTVASFVPIIVLFFLAMTVVEDSGYLSRIAYLMDALMAKLGLDGRSFVMVLMGFGCNVPALMGTRVMRSNALRRLTMLVIPFSLCSARLQVFLFLTSALFVAETAPIVIFSLYLLSFATAILTALVFKKHFASTEPFVIELPPYRLPTLRQVLLRGWQEVRHFLRRATKFIMAGVMGVWLLTHFPESAMPNSPDTWAGHLALWLKPLLDPIGIDAELGLALIFGFVAKEIVVGSLAAIYGLEGDALMGLMAQKLDWVQGYSFMLFTLIYIPCLSTIATLKSETNSRLFAAISVAWSLLLAWGVCWVFYQGARALGY